VLDCRASREMWWTPEMSRQPLVWMKKHLAPPSVAVWEPFLRSLQYPSRAPKSVAMADPACPAVARVDLCQLLAFQPKLDRRHFSWARLARLAPACPSAVAKQPLQQNRQ